MRAVRWALGGAIVAVVGSGAVLGVIALVAEIFRASEPAGFVICVAVIGAVVGALLLDLKQDVERQESWMSRPISYPGDGDE